MNSSKEKLKAKLDHALNGSNHLNSKFSIYSYESRGKAYLYLSQIKKKLDA